MTSEITSMDKAVVSYPAVDETTEGYYVANDTWKQISRETYKKNAVS